MKRRNTFIVASSVAAITAGALGSLMFLSAPHASADPTVLGKLQVEAHTHAEDVAITRMSWKVNSTTSNPKVSINTILSNMESPNSTEATSAMSLKTEAASATSIEAVHAVVSGIPAIMVNPKYISDDPQIQVNGDYLDNVPVWIITFNGVQPIVMGPKGVTVKGVPNNHTEVFDANTGDRLMGFSGN